MAPFTLSLSLEEHTTVLLALEITKQYIQNGAPVPGLKDNVSLADLMNVQQRLRDQLEHG